MIFFFTLVVFFKNLFFVQLPYSIFSKASYDYILWGEYLLW